MAINKEIKTSMNLTITKELKKELELIAKQESRSTTNLINLILQQYIDNKKKGSRKY